MTMTVLSLKILSTRWNSGRSDGGYDDNNGAYFRRLKQCLCSQTMFSMGLTERLDIFYVFDSMGLNRDVNNIIFMWKHKGRRPVGIEYAASPSIGDWNFKVAVFKFKLRASLLQTPWLWSSRSLNLSWLALTVTFILPVEARLSPQLHLYHATNSRRLGWVMAWTLVDYHKISNFTLFRF